VITLVPTEEDGTTTMSARSSTRRRAREAALQSGAKDGWSTSYDGFDEHLRTMA
jgi:hypothetical protein